MPYNHIQLHTITLSHIITQNHMKSQIIARNHIKLHSIAYNHTKFINNEKTFENVLKIYIKKFEIRIK